MTRSAEEIAEVEVEEVFRTIKRGLNLVRSGHLSGNGIVLATYRDRQFV